MKLNVAQVIGLNTDQQASLVISTIRDEENAFFAVLELSCDDAFTRGRQILSEISDFYFDLEAGPSDNLSVTFKEAEKRLEQTTFSLSLATIAGKVLYIIGKKGVHLYLKREEKLSPLLSVGSEGQIISGFVQENDRLLFATNSLVNFLADDLPKSLNLSLDDFEEETTARVSAANLEDNGLAGLLVEIAKQLPDEVIPSIDSHEEPQKLETHGESRDSYSNSKEQEYSYPSVFKDTAKLKKITNLLKKIPGKLLALRSHFPKSGRGRLVVAVVLILIIVAGVGYKYKLSKDQQKDTIFNQTLNEAKDNFKAAHDLSTLSPKEAKDKLDAAKTQVNKALSIKPKDTDANNLKNQIEKDTASILQQISVADFPLFLDMDLVKKNFRAQIFSLSSGKLLLLDPSVETLVAIDISKKSNQILAGADQLGDATGTSLNGGLAFIYSKNKGVLKIDTTNQKLTPVAKKDTNLGTISDIYGFAGNIYLLDSTKNQIWKYLPTSDGYSDAREYLTKNTKADFSNALRMQIESSVYVLKKGGEIYRFTRGDKDNFALEGLDKGVKDPKSFFVSSDTDNLYLLDSGNSRLLILTKSGSYKGQMNGSEFGQASDLVVDEVGKKVFLLDGGKIYATDLK